MTLYTKEQLTEDLMSLKYARDGRDRAKERLDVLVAKFNMQPDVELERELLKQYNDEIEKTETLIRSMGVLLYDGVNKDIGHGVKIRVMSKLEYDKTVAFEWAKKHQLALQLDVKEFESMAKVAPQNIDFVKHTLTPTITIPTNIEVKI